MTLVPEPMRVAYGSDAPPVTVYVLLRDDCTIAGIKRDPFESPRGLKGWQVVAYTKAAAAPGQKASL